MRGSGSSHTGSGAGPDFRGGCCRRGRRQGASWPAIPTVPAYIGMQVRTSNAVLYERMSRANSVRQIGRDQRRRRPDRGGGLEGEASTCEVEVVAAQGIYVAVVQATLSQSEDEQNRRPMFQEPGQERCGRRFLRIRSVRRHDDFAQLRREASLRELERLEPAEVR